MNQHDKGVRFRELHAVPGAFVVPDHGTFGFSEGAMPAAELMH